MLSLGHSVDHFRLCAEMPQTRIAAGPSSIQQQASVSSRLCKRGSDLACSVQCTTTCASFRNEIPHSLTFNPLIGWFQPYPQGPTRLPAKLFPDEAIIGITPPHTL